MTDKPETAGERPGWSDLEAANAGFECKTGVGLTVADDVADVQQGSRWLSWGETVAMHQWLGQKIKEFANG